MELPLLKDIFVIFGLAVAVALVCHRFRIPPVVGLILTGVIAGPHGLRLTTEEEAVAQLAEIGVIFLLFTIGLEFSIDSIRLVKRLFFVGGPLQVSLTAGLVFLTAIANGAAPHSSIGLTASLSSTAIILRLLQERPKITSAHGKGTMAILIFQDIAFVPMMLVIPFLAGQGGENTWRGVGVLWSKVGVHLAGDRSAAPRLMPRLLTHIARTQSNELFLLSIGVVCFFVAWLTSLAGPFARPRRISRRVDSLRLRAQPSRARKRAPVSRRVFEFLLRIRGHVARRRATWPHTAPPCWPRPSRWSSSRPS